MNWVKKMIKKIRGWQPWVSEDVALMDPKLISGVHVEMSFDVQCDIDSISECLVSCHPS